MEFRQIWILWIFTCDDTWNPLCKQLLWTTKRHFIAMWMRSRLSATVPASRNGCGGPLWEVSRYALNLIEDIFVSCYKCILSAISHKLNASGQMLIWTFCLVLVCGTRAQNFSAPFSYTRIKRYLKFLLYYIRILLRSTYKLHANNFVVNCTRQQDGIIIWLKLSEFMDLKVYNKEFLSKLIKFTFLSVDSVSL
jgi:hypothetical protein